MKLRSLLPTLLLLITLLASCGRSHDAEQILQQAETAISQGDMKMATSTVQQLSDSTALDALSVSQLGRLSIVYMQLADSVDSAENVGYAAQAYRRAYALQPDSANDFYSALPTDKANLAMILANIVSYNPNDTLNIPEFEEEGEFDGDYIEMR